MIINLRIVSVYDLKLLASTTGIAEMEMHCGKGSYVCDRGEILGCYGHISVLRCTVVGVFSEESVIPLDVFEKMVQSSDADFYLQPVETVLDDITALALTDEEIRRIKQGQSLKLLSRRDIDRLDVAGINETTDLLLALGHNKFFNPVPCPSMAKDW